MQGNVFETERLKVRKLKTEDFNDLFIVCSDPILMKFVGSEKPLTKEQTNKWIEVTLINYEIKGYGNYAIINRFSDTFMGYCGLVFSKDINEVELIYALKMEYWGKGFASEAAKAMISFGLDTIGLQRIYASIDPGNIISRKILNNIGFVFSFERPDEFGLTTLYFVIEKKK